MSSNYRSIAPAIRRPSPDKEQENPAQPKKRKRNIACNNCRATKTGCNGERPACARCIRDKTTCEYVTASNDETPQMALERLQGDLKQHADVLEHLRSVPDSEALETVRRLRSTPDLSIVLSTIRNNVPQKRPSNLKAAQGIFPPMTSNIEFELTALHGLAYPVLAPLDTRNIVLDDFSGLDQDSWYPIPVPSPMVSRGMREPNLPFEIVDPRFLGAETISLHHGNLAEKSNPVGRTLIPEQYCDPHLNDLDLAYWTKVPITKEYAASAISIYLENEHIFIGSFDPELFLKDLVDRRSEYCSSFLVNAVLCVACQCYAGFDDEAFSLSLAFFREAEKLWRANRFVASINTLAATSMLSCAANFQGTESLGLKIFSDVRRMAEEMDLLGIAPTEERREAYQEMSLRKIRAFSYTAWGTYCWLSNHASFYAESPIMYPPILPVPGEESRRSVASSKSWPAHPLPAYMGNTFPALCKYWTLFQTRHIVYHEAMKETSPLQETVPLALAEEWYQKLLYWTDTLQNDMTRGPTSATHVLCFHALYHVAVLNIFRPFLQDKKMRLSSFSSPDSRPDTVFIASIKQLQRLILQYRAYHSPRVYSTIFNTAIIHITYFSLCDEANLNWRFYFLLCMGHLKKVSARFPVITSIAQAYLSLGLNRGRLTGKEARILKHEFDLLARRHQNNGLSEQTAQCIVDFDIALNNKAEGRADQVTEEFELLAAFEEFVDV